MNAPLRRGACPTLAAPMQTGDGLLARLNPVASGLAPATLAALCEAALRHGNGMVEVTARGSLQIRGLTPASAAPLARAVDTLGLAVRGGIPVETGPLAGLDPHEVTDSRPLAERISDGIPVAGLEGRLGPKVSVVVDGGGHSGLDEVAADVRLTARRNGSATAWRLAVAGDAATATPLADLSEAAACEAALAVLAAVAASGREGRARDLAAEALARLAGQHSFAPPSVLPDISPARGEMGSFEVAAPPAALKVGEVKAAGAISPLAGEMSGRTEGGSVKRKHSRRADRSFDILPLTDGRFAVTAALPFGQIHAGALIGFVGKAAAAGAEEIRLAPRRALILPCPSAASAKAVRDAAARAGLIVDAGDPRARIAACPGAPACASGHIAARTIAAEIAGALPPGLDIDLHVSGCAKRCARPGHEGLTLLGCDGGAGLVMESAGREPVARVAREEAAAAFGRVAALVTAERRAGESGRACLARLGGRRLAEAFVGKQAEASPAVELAEERR